MKASLVKILCKKCGSIRPVVGEGTAEEVEAQWLKYGKCAVCESALVSSPESNVS